MKIISLRIEIDENLKNKFKSKCSAEGITMNKKISKLMINFINEDFKKES